MAATSTVKTRIQLKNDTEENWNKTQGRFTPLKGEVIIYSTDDTHPFPRLKVGDGETNVTMLPFIDAGTVKGIDLTDYMPSKLAHSIIFGANEAYRFDGSQDVIVPVYTGVTI